MPDPPPFASAFVKSHWEETCAPGVQAGIITLTDQLVVWEMLQHLENYLKPKRNRLERENDLRLFNRCRQELGYSPATRADVQAAVVNPTAQGKSRFLKLGS